MAREHYEALIRDFPVLKEEFLQAIKDGYA